jgi:hypothetical protein
LKSLLHLNGRYEPDTIGRLGAGLADGLPIKSACLIAGIGVSTLADWREKYPELEERMAEAREVARQKMLQQIKRAAPIMREVNR